MKLVTSYITAYYKVAYKIGSNLRDLWDNKPKTVKEAMLTTAWQKPLTAVGIYKILPLQYT